MRLSSTTTHLQNIKASGAGEQAARQVKKHAKRHPYTLLPWRPACQCGCLRQPHTSCMQTQRAGTKEGEQASIAVSSTTVCCDSNICCGKRVGEMGKVNNTRLCVAALGDDAGNACCLANCRVRLIFCITSQQTPALQQWTPPLCQASITHNRHNCCTRTC
jgi:hypothetical protein